MLDAGYREGNSEGDGEDDETAEILGRIYPVRPFELKTQHNGTQSCWCVYLIHGGVIFLLTRPSLSINGLRIRTTAIIPDTFRCLTCLQTFQVEIDHGKIGKQLWCPRDV